ncbi:peptidoglycan editing factor PgeF [Sphingorhabdus sp.]|uniref:peptidoglycan editing factor PgeF n=1 Tax=Sphingorhabdus sp. TaxID=1902408 RepID=UPI0039199CF7
MAVEVIQSGVLRSVAHGFLGRSGGVSTGIYAGLNVGLGSEDTRESVIENRLLSVQSVLPGARLARVHQFHSADVVQVGNDISEDDPPRGDAIVTDCSNVLLGIVTADCVPVLFADAGANIIGAAHAGWKGAISGVLENTVTAMEKLGADVGRISCAIGPCISQKSYEVDEGFFRNFVELAAANEHFFADGRAGHYQFDIEGYVAARLAAAGIRTVECLGEDTYSQPDRFFSYRRSCHLGEPGYGRQLSLIGLHP